jgi:hypothetical protein
MVGGGAGTALPNLPVLENQAAPLRGAGPGVSARLSLDEARLAHAGPHRLAPTDQPSSIIMRTVLAVAVFPALLRRLWLFSVNDAPGHGGAWTICAPVMCVSLGTAPETAVLASCASVGCASSAAGSAPLPVMA